MGENMATGKIDENFVELPLGEANPDGESRLENNVGLTLRVEDEKVIVDQVGFDSPAEKAKIDFDWQITVVELPNDRLPKEVFWIPALGLLGLIIVVQRRRRKIEEGA